MWTIAGTIAAETAVTLVRRAKKTVTMRPVFASFLKSIIVTPSRFSDEFFHARKHHCLQAANHCPNSMGSIYVEQPFAKMTGLPDNLTETPDCSGRGGNTWTFSIRS
jgi:hypothetical protein